MLRLEKRPQPSEVWVWATPLIAVAATMIAGGILFAMLGKDPVIAMKAIFWDPLFGPNASYFRPQLLVKAGPLILIAVGLSLGFRAGIWNIGAEGQYIMGALSGAGVALAAYPAESVFLFPAMIVAGAFGGFVWAMIPAVLKIRFGTNEILVSLMLVYVAKSILAYMAFGPLKNPDGFNFPGSRNLHDYPSAYNQDLIAGTGIHWGVVAALVAVVAAHIALNRHMLGFHIKVAGQAPRAARFAGVDPRMMVALCMGISGALAGLAGLFEVSGPGGQITDSFNANYGFTAIIVAFLGRLNPAGILFAGLLLALTYIGGDAARLAVDLPAAAIQALQGMLLFFLLAFDLLVNFRIRMGEGRGMTVFGIDAGLLVASMMVAATPILLAATGELVAEKAGVLNLGVEGMMIMGAIAGLAAAVATGNPVAGFAAAAVAGMAMALLFALLTQFALTNQVATGLALTLFGLGLSALIGQGYQGLKPPETGKVPFGALTGIPVVGPVLFGHDWVVYLSLALVAATQVFLRRTRAGLVLRAVGENHDAAHALGYKVRAVRCAALAFGGALAGLGGAYLSLVRVPQWTEGMTAGAGWISLALVVFASWRPIRVLAGAYLFGGITVLQLALQARGIAIPVQILSMAPYLVTIMVLVLISSQRNRANFQAPASLGRSFHATT